MSRASIVLLPYAPSSVPAARWHLITDLRAAGVASQSVGDAALVVSELLSNAILHAKPVSGRWVEVSWALAKESVEVAVSDGGGSTRPRPVRSSLSSLGGRGLTLVEQLSSRWGVRRSDAGTTVWAILPAPGDRSGGFRPGARKAVSSRRG